MKVWYCICFEEDVILQLDLGVAMVIDTIRIILETYVTTTSFINRVNIYIGDSGGISEDSICVQNTILSKAINMITCKKSIKGSVVTIAMASRQFETTMEELENHLPDKFIVDGSRPYSAERMVIMNTPLLCEVEIYTGINF